MARRCRSGARGVPPFVGSAPIQLTSSLARPGLFVYSRRERPCRVVYVAFVFQASSLLLSTSGNRSWPPRLLLQLGAVLVLLASESSRPAGRLPSAIAFDLFERRRAQATQAKTFVTAVRRRSTTAFQSQTLSPPPPSSGAEASPLACLTMDRNLNHGA